MTTAALILLCGLPASGKSTLVRTLCRIWKRLDVPMDVSVISVDALQRETTFSASDWHAARDRAFTLVQDALKREREGQLLLVVDDTMFYRSMRRRFFLLATELSCAFHLLYVQCPLDSCLTRNAGRMVPLPDETIQCAHARFELPDGSQHYWESNLHTIDTTVVDVRHSTSCTLLANDLLSSWNAAVKRGVTCEEKERRQRVGMEANRQILHQLDLKMRAAVSDMMHRLKNRSPDADLVECGKRIRQLRTKHLERYRASIAQDSTIFDRTMEAAVEAFIQEMELQMSVS